MKRLNLRDLLAIGAIGSGLVVMYVLSMHAPSGAAAPAPTGAVTDTSDQTDAGDQTQNDQAFFALTSPQSSPAAVDFSLQDMHGNTVKLSDAVKNGPVILDFWATWCGPCRYELPKLSSMYDEYKSKGVQIYAVNTDTDEAGLNHFFENAHPDCPVLIDTGQAVGNQYSVTALPTVVVIDKQMRVRSRMEGADPNTEQDLGSSLDKLIKGA